MEPTKPLYHYTSQKGLLGILKDGKLRMTNILYLNDSSEYSHFFDLFLKKHKLDFNVEGLLQSIKTGPDYFVFSLSEKKDDLSQWRGYCSPTGGYCIEFDYTKLSSIIKESKGYKLEKILYSMEEKEEKFKSIANGLSVEHDSKDIQKLIIRMSRVAPYIKDKAFDNEAEWRIIGDWWELESNDIKFTEGKSMIMPFIEGLFLDDSFLPLSKIIVGPTPHKELSKKAVEALLNNSKCVKNVEVEYSKIPYRSW
jgi:hypothetical protein